MGDSPVPGVSEQTAMHSALLFMVVPCLIESTFYLQKK